MGITSKGFMNKGAISKGAISKGAMGKKKSKSSNTQGPLVVERGIENYSWLLMLTYKGVDYDCTFEIINRLYSLYSSLFFCTLVYC